MTSNKNCSVQFGLGASTAWGLGAIRANKSIVEHALAIGRVVVMSAKGGGTEWEGGKKVVEKVDGELGKEMWRSEQVHSQEHIQKTCLAL